MTQNQLMTQDQLTVNAIRILSAEAVQKANSGHPGLPMGSAAMAYTLWAKGMKHNPQNPKWVNRDRFVLSAGHASMLLYSLLHLFGYGLEMEDIKQFRQWGSKTPGHPEFGHTPGVEATSGPLGQGVAMAVGMAMAEKHLAAKFNRDGYNVVDHHTFVLAGDGCMMEGVASEAASMAGTMGLGKLIMLYDSNNITIEGDTALTFCEDVGKRHEAYGWQVLRVDDGNDIAAIAAAIEEAKMEKQKPTLIVVRTQIAFGSPLAGKSKAHGEPLGLENIQKTKDALGWKNAEAFDVPGEVYAHMKQVQNELAKNEAAWNALFADYTKKFPELKAAWDAHMDKALPKGLLEDEALWQFEGKMASRASSGEALNRLVQRLPNFFGGSADLGPSNKSDMKGKGEFSAQTPEGANIHFGVREFAMACACNGIALHGGLRPYGATFFVFCDYFKAAMRLSALMGQSVLYILTHDSIGVGEDGPTHEPVEQLAALRAMPGALVFRPADAKEVVAGYFAALSHEGPTVLVLTRQNLPLYEESGKQALKGGYILKNSQKAQPDMLLIASGSEVELAVKAQAVLKDKGVDARVVSMPCMELFDKQDEAYRESVLPKAVRKRVCIEAGASFGWHKYVGLDGACVCIDHYGASAPAEKLFEAFGFTVDNVVAKALSL